MSSLLDVIHCPTSRNFDSLALIIECHPRIHPLFHCFTKSQFYHLSNAWWNSSICLTFLNYRTFVNCLISSNSSISEKKKIKRICTCWQYEEIELHKIQTFIHFNRRMEILKQIYSWMNEGRLFVCLFVCFSGHTLGTIGMLLMSRAAQIHFKMFSPPVKKLFNIE
jgi:hypothetical protein